MKHNINVSVMRQKMEGDGGEERGVCDPLSAPLVRHLWVGGGIHL